jgi:hypothetical protein
MKLIARLLIYAALGCLLSGCAGDSHKPVRSSVSSSLLTINSWIRGDIPDHFAIDSLSAELQILGSLLPSLNGEVALPINAISRTKAAMEQSDRARALLDVSEIEVSLQNLDRH